MFFLGLNFATISLHIFFQKKILIFICPRGGGGGTDLRPLFLPFFFSFVFHHFSFSFSWILFYFFFFFFFSFSFFYVFLYWFFLF